MEFAALVVKGLSVDLANTWRGIFSQSEGIHCMSTATLTLLASAQRAEVLSGLRDLYRKHRDVRSYCATNIIDIKGSYRLAEEANSNATRRLSVHLHVEEYLNVDSTVTYILARNV